MKGPIGLLMNLLFYAVTVEGNKSYTNTTHYLNLETLEWFYSPIYKVNLFNMCFESDRFKFTQDKICFNNTSKGKKFISFYPHETWQKYFIHSNKTGTPKPILYCPTPKLMLSAPTPKLMLSAPTPKPMLSAPIPKLMLSAPIPKLILSAPIPKPMLSAPIPKLMILAPITKLMLSAPIPKPMLLAPITKPIMNNT